MYKDDILAKIRELEREREQITATDYHRQEYKKLLTEKIESYKRLLKQAKKKRKADPFALAFGTKPVTQGDARREKKGRYLNNL